MACWSGWIEDPIAPLFVRLRQVHVVPERSPRWTSMAPQYTCVSRSGATARNQSYQAWLILTPGGAATDVHVPAARRRRYVVPPSVERFTPSPHPARISADGPPAGAIESDHVWAVRRRVQLTPPSVET